MKNILGLDLGTNSIGWAVVSQKNEASKPQIHLGSRIIPMSKDILDTFSKGQSYSQTHDRTQARSMRRMYQRHQLRRQRLLRVLHLMKFLPEHYDRAFGWEPSDTKTFAKFINQQEVRLAWAKDVCDSWMFLFHDAFEEMMSDFAKLHPELLANGHKIPYDWTLYYLRKKALMQAISPYELSWILLSFNQKRGYYQLRGMDDDNEEDEENPKERKEYVKLKVVDVQKEDADSKGKIWWALSLENGWVYRRPSNTPLDSWKDTVHEFIVTTPLDKDGKEKVDTDGNVKRRFQAPQEGDWTLLKKRTENNLANSGKTVGEYIYDSILENPSQKIRGKLIATIERKNYKDELMKILTVQARFIPALSDKELFKAAVSELYPNNANHRENVLHRDIIHFFVDDILFYQRPLKSKKSLIADCPYEKRSFVDKETGEIKEAPVKCIARSNPYFQEFRLWGFIQNLRVQDMAGMDVTASFLGTVEAKAKLFDWFNDRVKVSQTDFLHGFLGLPKPKTGQNWQYKWNMVDKDFPANETRGMILSQLAKAKIDPKFLNESHLYHLWHILYSVSDVEELKKALAKYAKENGLSNDFVTVFSKSKPFAADYASYSEKAIRKLLSVMRMGKYWNYNEIPEEVRQNISAIISGDIDDALKVRLESVELTKADDFQGLPEWLACYVVYNCHSEVSEIAQWTTPNDVRVFINNFRLHSLNNPIVEQVVMETLRTVEDIMKQFGTIDEIHVEMGRDLRNPASKRQQTFADNQNNETRNMRIRLLLQEMKMDSHFTSVRPYSPTQQEILKIYEEGVLLGQDNLPDDIRKIVSASNPTSSEINKYKLWLDQKYKSPYTGQIINFSRLFSTDYQIEHIIPQARYFDDSFSNKVICESEVNLDKSNQLAHVYIKSQGGKKIHTAAHGDVFLLTLENYESLVKKVFSGNTKKMRNLLADDIPEQFIQRQMNDTRYISRYIKGLLSNIVRLDGEQEATSKNLIPCTGQVTDRLKQDWGLNDVWNGIIAPRFMRLNTMTKSDGYGYWDNKDGHRVFQTQVPLDKQQGFSKKRIDHRHHAMDALAIACASRSIVRYLANENAGNIKERDQSRAHYVHNHLIDKPWSTFTEDAAKALSEIIVSFKGNNRILSHSTNRYQHYNSEGKKVLVTQTGEDRWAIRRSLHKATVFGKVNLRQIEQRSIKDALNGPLNRFVDKQIKVSLQQQKDLGFTNEQILAALKKNKYQLCGKDVRKVEVYAFTEEKKNPNTLSYFATRKSVDDSFDEKTFAHITDTGIQKILLNRLHDCYDDPKVAFSPEGIEEMNRNIQQYNGGRKHQPILKVRWFEQSSKFPVGENGCRNKKFVEADKGTNLFLGIYVDEEGKRYYESIPLSVAIERQKQGLEAVPEKDEQDHKLLISLSPNDLVYVPGPDEQNIEPSQINKENIYLFVNSGGSIAFFRKASVANFISNKMEFSTQNKAERAASFGTEEVYGVQIKSVCWKLEVDRLGNVTKIIR